MSARITDYSVTGWVNCVLTSFSLTSFFTHYLRNVTGGGHLAVLLPWVVAARYLSSASHSLLSVPGRKARGSLERLLKGGPRLSHMTAPGHMCATDTNDHMALGPVSCDFWWIILSLGCLPCFSIPLFILFVIECEDIRRQLSHM